jgi:hypothetical protein
MTLSLSSLLLLLPPRPPFAAVPVAVVQRQADLLAAGAHAGQASICCYPTCLQPARPTDRPYQLKTSRCCLQLPKGLAYLVRLMLLKKQQER